jgi:predicted ATPase
VRIAFSGTHRTGKTTLVAAIADRLPGYHVFDEPYRVLEEAGYDFADPPSVEDYEEQLRTSIELVSAAPADALFDRCPLDVVAYLQAVDEDCDDWLDDIRDAMARIDLLVVVPIEDRIPVPAHEDRRLRRRVDERLQRLVLDDPFGFEVATVEVSGSVAERVEQVARAMRIRAPRR